MARSGLAFLVGFLLASLAPTLVTETEAGGGGHPHFDDQGTLDWYRSLDDARRAARAEGKLIFVDYGRLRCSQCRTLCNRVLPDPRVRARLARAAVGLASNCDRPEQAIRRLFQQHLPRARTLPFVAFVTPDGEYVTGFGGSCSVERFLAHLGKAEQRLAARTPSAPPPAPRVRPEPTPVPPAPRPVTRPERHRPVPAPTALAGSPDAVNVPAPPHGPPASLRTSGCCAPPRVERPQGPLPPPRIRINAPVKVRAPGPALVAARSVVREAPAAPTPVHRVKAAAARGAWDEVISLCARSPADPKLEPFYGRARAWADERLTFAVDRVMDGSYDSALDAVEQVLLAMRGEPESVDAARGLNAIKTLLELRYLNPSGDAAKALRRRAYEDMWGTRWARLFS